MSVERMMNHRARVWRRLESVGEMREVVNGWQVVTEPPTWNNLWTSPQDRRLRDDGPGEAIQGVQSPRWFMRKEAVVAERDVVELVSGPEAPSYWNVQSASSPSRPNESRHHWRIAVEPYNGPAPEEGS
jgi:hypothetical protein